MSIKPLNHICIYILLDPVEGIPKYVGSSESPDKRFKDHCLQTGIVKERTVNKWIADLRAQKRDPVMLVVDSIPRDQAERVEKEWIDHFILLGVNLLNTKIK